MKKFSGLLCACLFVFSVPIMSQTVGVNPTRPSASDNAFITHYGYSEIELGMAFQKNFWNVPALIKVSPWEKIELGLIFSGLINHIGGADPKTEMGDKGLQIKGIVAGGDNYSVAAVARAELISGNESKVTAYLTPSLITSFGQFDATTGVYFPGGSQNSFVYAAAFSPKMQGKIGAYLELYGEASEFYNPLSFDFGFSYAHTADFVLDASLSLGLNNDAPDWLFQVGFTKLMFRIF